MEKQTGYRIKIVERTGTKLVDMLHRANPWQGQDCQRQGCLLCSTKIRTGRNLEQECTQRCLVYETWCLNCEDEEIKKIEEEEEEGEKKRSRIKNISRYVYIGETSRSIYERGLEHIRDKNELKKDSHMIKHYFDKHEGEDLENIEFGIRILRTTKTAFNRQILESVMIQSSKTRNHILNSRSEYNRCALPRLTAKMGDDTYDKIDKIKKEEKKAELELEKKIRNLKVLKSKERRWECTWQDQPASKKRKITSSEHKKVLHKERNQEKRKEPEEEKAHAGADRVEKRKNYSIFQNKKKKIEEQKIEKPDKDMDKEAIENDTLESQEQIDWDKKLEEKEKRIEKDAMERKERLEKAERLNKSYELLRLCRETLKLEGETWEISKERRELEKIKEYEKRERLLRAKDKKEKMLEKIKTKEIQTKITDNLNLIPKNRKILVEARIEKERLLDIKEAREKIWKKWRHNKGKSTHHPRILKRDSKEQLEEKLAKIEKEVERYNDEMRKIEEDKEKKKQQIKKKESKQKHWEMMKWVVRFIDENKDEWSRIKLMRKKDMERKQEREIWEKKSMEEKRKELIEEEANRRRKEKRSNKELRLAEVTEMKKNWKRREPPPEIKDEDDELDMELEKGEEEEEVGGLAAQEREAE